MQEKAVFSNFEEELAISLLFGEHFENALFLKQF